MDKKLEQINELLQPYGIRVMIIFHGKDSVAPALFSTDTPSIAEEFNFGIKELPDRRIQIHVGGIKRTSIDDFQAFREKVDQLADVLDKVNGIGYLVPTKEQLHSYEDKPLQIWQIPTDDEEAKKLKFLPMDMIRKLGDPDQLLRREKYKLIYAGEPRPNEALEDIYYRFNMMIPLDFTGHSLSVSDVVVLNGKAYFVDTIGFVELKDF